MGSCICKEGGYKRNATNIQGVDSLVGSQSISTQGPIICIADEPAVGGELICQTCVFC